MVFLVHAFFLSHEGAYILPLTWRWTSQVWSSPSCEREYTHQKNHVFSPVEFTLMWEGRFTSEKPCIFSLMPTLHLRVLDSHSPMQLPTHYRLYLFLFFWERHIIDFIVSLIGVRQRIRSLDFLHHMDLVVV